MDNQHITRIQDTIFVIKNSNVEKRSLQYGIAIAVNRAFTNLHDELTKICAKKFVFSQNHDVVYIPQFKKVVPDPRKFEFANLSIHDKYQTPKKRFRSFYGFDGTALNIEELKYLFLDNSKTLSEYCSLISSNVTNVLYKAGTYQWCSLNNPDIKQEFLTGSSMLDAIVRQNMSCQKTTALFCPCAPADFYYLLFDELKFVPELLTASSIKLLKLLQNNLGMFTFSDTGIKPKSAFYKLIEKNPTLLFEEITPVIPKFIIDSFLSCDEVRADLEKYPARMMTDINRGHWDLWALDMDQSNMSEIKLSEPIVARNPIADVKQNGLIGIDFGTKSTVVVCKDGAADPFPLRVGLGQLHKKAEAKHYENPTILEFIDINSFLKAYQKHCGRPFTRWEDVTVSHTALHEMLEDTSSSYNAYFSSLKQWCSEKDLYAIISDKNGNQYHLRPYMSNENTIDPIEIYAYYLGLYINNMYQGIYLNYIMSFPVSFEKPLRDRILPDSAKLPPSPTVQSPENMVK